MAKYTVTKRKQITAQNKLLGARKIHVNGYEVPRSVVAVLPSMATAKRVFRGMLTNTIAVYGSPTKKVKTNKRGVNFFNFSYYNVVTGEFIHGTK